MIEFRNYSFTYPGAEKKALEDINLSFSEGGFYLLIGASGSGKTTLLKSLKPAIAPHGEVSGDILYKGFGLNEMSPEDQAKRIGYVGQNPEEAIITDKVWHELSFGLESLGMSLGDMKLRVSEMADFFGLIDIFDRDTMNLSGGQKQLLSLASVMAMNPEVLILDEPTGQLDPLAASDFLHALHRINEELGVTVILSEHRLEEAFALADRVIMLDGGRIIKEAGRDVMADYLSSLGEDSTMYEGLPAYMKLHRELKMEGQTPVSLKAARIAFAEKYGDILKREKLSPLNSYSSLEAVMELRHGLFSYEGSDREILRDASLSVRGGQIYALLGANGAGKTTLLKAMTGSIDLEQGEIYYRGKKVNKKNPLPKGKGGVVMLPQDPKAVFTGIKVSEELTNEDWIKRLKLEDKLDMHPYELSGGEQQKLALGKALSMEPDILFLDEPTKGMDPLYKEMVADLLREETKKGLTVVMVTHDVEFAAKHADRCGLFFDGEVCKEGLAGSFFAGNTFYTTGVNKIVRNILPNSVTVKEVKSKCTMDS